MRGIVYGSPVDQKLPIGTKKALPAYLFNLVECLVQKIALSIKIHQVGGLVTDIEYCYIVKLNGYNVLFMVNQYAGGFDRLHLAQHTLDFSYVCNVILV